MSQEDKQKATDALVLVVRTVIGCIPRQGELGFLVEEAISSLSLAKESGLILDATIVGSKGIE
jgi:hypothetical protein